MVNTRYLFTGEISFRAPKCPFIPKYRTTVPIVRMYVECTGLEDVRHTSGERLEYWLVAIQAAREASRLQGLSHSNVGRGRTVIRGRAHTQL